MLSINISELVLTIANFFLLFFLLKKFLYKPLITFMDERQARIDAGLDEERRADALLCEKQADLEAQLEQSRRDAEEIVRQAKADDAEKHRDMMEKARSEAAEARNDAKEKLEQLCLEDREKLSADSRDYAEKLVERLVQQAKLG